MRKIDYAGLLVAVLCVVGFGRWLQGELDRGHPGGVGSMEPPAAQPPAGAGCGGPTAQCGVIRYLRAAGPA